MIRRYFSFFFLGAVFFFPSSYAALTLSTSEQTSRFRITNQCDKALWIQQDYKSKTNDPIVVQVPKGQSYDYAIPDGGLASTRFWPKSECNSYGYNCAVGESTGVPEAEKMGYQQGPYAPDINSKFEATWGCLKAIFDNNPSLCAVNPSSPSTRLNGETWWNGSAVDGYTFPYSIVVKNHNSSCVDLNNGAVLTNPGVNCGQLSVASCPANANLSSEGLFNKINGIDVTRVNLQWLNPKTGTPIGCFSPCSKLTTSQGSDNGQTGGGWRTILGGITPQSPQAQWYCCPTPPISPGACSAGPAARSEYSIAVHNNQQCDSYTYAYDDAKGLAKCGSQARFEVVFCPKTTPPTTPPSSVSMKIIVPPNVLAQINDAPVGNNQVVQVTQGLVFSIASSSKPNCTVAVSPQLQVSGVSGSLCSQLKIDNGLKTITFPNTQTAPTQKVAVQFNMNTTAGISAYLNGTIIVNATPMVLSTLPKNSVLSAYQGSKVGICNLTVTSNSMEKGAGELCQRLNIVPEGANKIHIYLPADIPHTGGTTVTPPPAKPKYVAFGMDPSQYAYLKNTMVTNGSQIALSTFDGQSTLELVAYQNQKSARCTFTKSGDVLKISTNTGTLCNAGLVLMVKSNGDYYIGIPNPLPEPTGKAAYGLGIAQGMSVKINNELFYWNSVNKTVYLAEGTTNFYIQGVNKVVLNCPITRYGQALSWPKTTSATDPCRGLVYSNGIIYFPAF
jgi:hypothetical protein